MVLKVNKIKAINKSVILLLGSSETVALWRGGCSDDEKLMGAYDIV